ncbi:MAG: elongation factor Ts [Actinomycetales bacterium]|nr:elongation factor Ts [Actinomycetales bacterium]
MANITASDVKRLRESTGAGMMDCKNALMENDGDFDKAVEYLRVKGQAGVAKREGRATANGLVATHTEDGFGVLVEVNCETDFVAKGERFQDLGRQVLEQAVAVKATDVAGLLESSLPTGGTVSDLVVDAIATIGEKIQIGRLARIEASHVASYLHKTNPDLPPQVGVLVGATGAADVVRDVAMHVAAMIPVYLDRDSVPEDVVANERRIAEETAREEGKPEKALPRIVEGRVNGFFKDKVLVDQAFARDNKKTVGAVLAEAGVSATGFARFRVGA